MCRVRYSWDILFGCQLPVRTAGQAFHSVRGTNRIFNIRLKQTPLSSPSNGCISAHCLTGRRTAAISHPHKAGLYLSEFTCWVWVRVCVCAATAETDCTRIQTTITPTPECESESAKVMSFSGERRDEGLETSYWSNLSPQSKYHRPGHRPEYMSNKRQNRLLLVSPQHDFD